MCVDDVVYFSPCHAGCVSYSTQEDQKVLIDTSLYTNTDIGLNTSKQHDAMNVCPAVPNSPICRIFHVDLHLPSINSYCEPFNI